MLTLFVAAVGLGLAVAAPVGPTGATAIRQGLAGGWRQTFWIGQGAALTDFLYILATYAGLTPLLARFVWLPLVLYGAGVVMIGRMAWSAIREAVLGTGAAPAAEGTALVAGGASAPRPSPTPSPLPWHRALRLGLALTVVNPATITSWLSMGGSFIAANVLGRSVPASLLLMSGIWVGSALWFTLLAGIVGVARAAVGRIPWLFRAVSGISGLVLAGFAVRFAWQLGLGLLGLWRG